MERDSEVVFVDSSVLISCGRRNSTRFRALAREARRRETVFLTSDVSDFGGLPTDAHAGVVLLYDNTMPAYRVASGLIAMVDAYPDRNAFGGREELDAWV